MLPLDDSGRAITRHKRLYGCTKQEAMDWLPYLEQLSRSPGAYKYSGVYGMMPDPLRTYIERQEKSERGKTLKVIAWLTQKDGFTNAVQSVGEAVQRNAASVESLVTLHGYLMQKPVQERMDTQGIKTILPPLPEVHFNGKSYDKIIQNAAYGNE